MVEACFFSVEDRCRTDGNGDVELLPHFRTVEARAANAHDLEGVMIQRKGLADGARCASVVVLPEAVTQHGDGGAAALVVGSGQHPAHRWPYSQRGEIAAAREDSVGVLHPAALREVKLLFAPGEHSGKEVLP